MRTYKSGSRWAFWRCTFTDTGYLTRLFLLKTPWFCICLHWINEPDPEPHLHDHPVSFLSLVLRGAYSELRWREGEIVPRVRRRRWWNYVRASTLDRHSIIQAEPKTLTLALMGPKTREWGFHLRDGQWLHWKTYNDLKREGYQP